MTIKQTPNPLLPPPPEKRKEPSLPLKIAVLTGLIILLIIGVLLPIKIVPNTLPAVKNFFANLFTSDKTIQIDIDKTRVASGELFTITWNTDREGSYVLEYDCVAHLTLITSVAEPDETIPCGTPYYFLPDSNEIIIRPVLESTEETDVEIRMSFLADQTTKTVPMGDVGIEISNPAYAATPARPQTPQRSTTTPSTPRQSQQGVASTIRPSNPNGLVDLSVTIIRAGYLHPTTLRFVASPSVPRGMRPAFQFVVTNKGTKNSGLWNFTAQLPSQSNPVYSANNLTNLAPGQTTLFTLGFEYPKNTGYNTATVIVDSIQQIPELNEINNTNSLSLFIQ